MRILTIILINMFHRILLSMSISIRVVIRQSIRNNVIYNILNM